MGDTPETQRYHNNALDRPLPSGHSAGSRQRRRFAQDGDVPTVIVAAAGSASSAPRATNRLAIAEAALEAERQARLRAEKALTTAQDGLRGLHTQQAHLVMARDEAVADLKRVQAKNDRLAAGLDAAQKALGTAEQALQLALESDERARAHRPAGVAAAPAHPPAKAPARPRGRPPGSKTGAKSLSGPKQKPVRWW
jgi:septal ring factor EnvC (AmiA/AmiB activator)